MIKIEYLQVVMVLLFFSCQEQVEPDIELSATLENLELFAEGLVSTGYYERDIAINSDGTELIYSLGDYKQSLRCLVSIKKSNNAWQKPQVLNFTGTYNDIEPFINPAGDRLYFASDRPLNKDDESNDYNLWYCNKTESGWSDPIALDTIINSDSDEYYPSMSRNGNLYFTSSRENGIGSEDIFRSEFIAGKYEKPEALDTNINTATYEFNAYVNPDEDLLIFGSFGRPDGFGGGDLYISTKTETGQWSKAKNMGDIINTEKLDYCPFIDYPRNMFYFSSDRMDDQKAEIKTIAELHSYAERTLNGMGNIYRMPLEKALYIQQDSLQ